MSSTKYKGFISRFFKTNGFFAVAVDNGMTGYDNSALADIIPDSSVFIKYLSSKTNIYIIFLNTKYKSKRPIKFII